MSADATAMEKYEARAQEFRRDFAEHPAIRDLGSLEIPTAEFLQWHYRYCLHGIHVTRDMEDVIYSAGSRSQEVGHDFVGEGLIKHARGETGHNLLMADDARAASAFLTAGGGVQLDTEAILADAGPIPSAQRYLKLFSGTSGGERPQTTVAALYEMEQLSAGIAINLLANCKRTMGDDRTRYTFLDEHVVVDIGHIALDRRMLEKALEQDPGLLDEMVEVGAEVLVSYAGFMGECLDIARADLAAARK